MDNALVEKFYDLPVYRPDKENCSKYLAVVASTARYEEISLELTEFGLEELKDYILYEVLGKGEYFCMGTVIPILAGDI